MYSPPLSPNSDGRCPHCGHIVTFSKPSIEIDVTQPSDRPKRPDGGPKGIAYVGEIQEYPTYLVTESGGFRVHVYSSRCPSCNKPVVSAEIMDYDSTEFKLVYPYMQSRFVPEEVPKDIKNDFLEATAVLPISEKASAALSRRCLQNILIDRGAKKDTLNNQIEWALPSLPSYLRDNLHTVRNIGNFAAHPIKSENTGIIAEVEPQEAEWNFVLEQLFDFYYVQPEKARKMREKIEIKRQK